MKGQAPGGVRKNRKVISKAKTISSLGWAARQASVSDKGLTAAPSRKPLVAKKDWRWLPQWIALHAERGTLPKCWEGHRLLKDRHDGRRHNPCVFCEKSPGRGAPILTCRKCCWSVCSKCKTRPRLPPLEDDPLFHGPDSPGLLQDPMSSKIDIACHGTVIVCPGGNYEFLVPHEGFPAAQWLGSCGIRTFVLRYRLLPKHNFEEMLDDLNNAVERVRCRFDGQVAAMGFSAGGHLVASLALRTAGKNASLKPLDAQVLVYPCIDGSDWGHPDDCGFFDWQNSFPAAKCLLTGKEALLGGPGFAAPPTFMVASTADESSPPKDHTDKYAKVLKQRQVPYVYLRRNYGAHGFGLTGGWTEKCLAWLKTRGFGH